MYPLPLPPRFVCGTGNFQDFCFLSQHYPAAASNVQYNNICLYCTVRVFAQGVVRGIVSLLFANNHITTPFMVTCPLFLDDPRQNIYNNNNNNIFVYACWCVYIYIYILYALFTAAATDRQKVPSRFCINLNFNSGTT